ncbi:MAG: pirin family protein [Moraxellaceae bacterium]|nr:pirin family protein [Moraxellaceae bacterium]
MSSVVRHLLSPHTRDLGGFTVRRLLPAASCRAVGPFIFFDHMGPAVFAPGEGVDVRPHPHIGLATVTYLFEGALMHRDSLGTVQEILPGDVNWMTAGRGIVHSERTPATHREKGSQANGLQFWVALPREHEQCDPAFQHCPADSLPRLDGRGNTLLLIAGEAFGLRSPVHALSPLFYADLQVQAGASFMLSVEHEERAIYPVAGIVRIGKEVLPLDRLAVLQPGQPVCIEADADARLMLLGGAPLDAPRHMWWNLVSSDPALIEQARCDWAEGRFPDVPGETDRIPLPAR